MTFSEGMMSLGKVEATPQRLHVVVIMLVFFWCGLTVLSSLYVMVPIMSEFSSANAISFGEASLFNSLFSISFAIGCLFFGTFSDQFGRKQIIFWGLILLMLISLAIGLSSNYWLSLTLRISQGFITATFSPVALAYIGDTFQAKSKNTAIGLISSGFLMSGVIGQLMSSWINQEWGWHAVFICLGILYFIDALLIFFLLPQDRVSHEKINLTKVGEQVINTFRQKDLVYCYFITLTILMTFVGTYSILEIFLSGPDFGLNDQEIFFIRAAGIIGMLVSPFAGKIIKRIGTLNTLRIGLLIASAGLVCLVYSQSIVQIVITSVLFVFGISMIVPAIISIINMIGAAFRGTATSFYTFFLFAGTGLGTVIVSQLITRTSAMFILLLFALFLFSSLLVSLLIKTRD